MQSVMIERTYIFLLVLRQNIPLRIAADYKKGSVAKTSEQTCKSMNIKKVKISEGNIPTL